MKNLYVLLLVIYLPLHLQGQSDQFAVGLNVGLGWNNIGQTQQDEPVEAFWEPERKNCFTLGLDLNQKITKNFALSIGIQYSNRGFKYSVSNGVNHPTHTLNYTYWSVPLIAHVNMWRGFIFQAGLEWARLQTLKSSPSIDPQLIGLRDLWSPNTYSKRYFIGVRQYWGPFRAVSIDVTDVNGVHIGSLNYHHLCSQLFIGYRFHRPSGS
jgi:hypothetical protein